MPFLHLDAYRINDSSEIDELGLDENVDDGVVLIIEWAMRVEKFLPPIDLSISIEQTGVDSRRFHFEPRTEGGRHVVDSIAKAIQATD